MEEFKVALGDRGKMVEDSNDDDIGEITAGDLIEDDDVGDTAGDKARLGNRAGAKLIIELEISANILGVVVVVFC